MSVEAEVERMVATLTGNATDYYKMLAEAKQATQSFAASVTSAFAAVGITAMVKAWSAAWGEQAGAQMRLGVAIEESGRPLEATKENYNEFAAALQRVSTIADQTTISMLGQAEMWGKTGDEAKNVVGISVAMAGVLGGSAQQHMRMARMVADGNVELAKRVFNLRDVKDHTELVDAIQKRLAVGLEIQNRVGQGAAGRLAQLSNEYNNLQESLGQVVNQGMKPVYEWGIKLVQWANSWDDGTKLLVVQVAAFGAGLLMLGPALRVAGFLLQPIISGLAVLVTWLVIIPVRLLISAAAWLIWNGAILAWNTVLLLGKAALFGFWVIQNLVNGSMLVWAGMYSLYAVAMAAWAAAWGLVQLAMLAVYGIATLVMAIFSVTGILTIALSLAAVAVAATVVYAGFRAIYAGWQAVVALFRESMHVGEVFGALGEAVGKWGEAIGGVVRAVVAGDLPLAWKLLVAGFAVVVGDVKDLFPPLWNYLVTGFSVAFNTLTATMKYEFLEATKAMLEASAFATGGKRAVELLAASNPFKWLEDQIQAAKGKIDPLFGEVIVDGEKKMAEAAAKFKNATSAETAEARAELDRLLAESGKLPATGESLKGLFGKLNIAEPIKEATSEIRKFDAALFGSADAVVRYQLYLDRLELGGPGKKGHGGSSSSAASSFSPPSVSEPGGGGATPASTTEKNTLLLTQIRDGILLLVEAKQVEFEAAGLGGV